MREHTYNIDALIEAINLDHVQLTRQLYGQDINDHVPAIDELIQLGEYSAAANLLEEIISLTHKLAQYDPHEPRSYWPEKAACVYWRVGDTASAIRVLEDWLTMWPKHRSPVCANTKIRVSERLARLKATEC